MTDVYTSLAYATARTAGCGIVRCELIVVGSEQHPAFVVVLRTNTDLWTRIASARDYTYPDGVVDAIGVMARAVLTASNADMFYLTPSEPAILALSSAEELQAAGVTLDEETYTVPNAMLYDSETVVRMAEPTTQSAAWAATLQRFSLESTDKAGVSFVVLPEGNVTPDDCTRATCISDPGWNFTNTFSPEDFIQVVAQLHRNLDCADPLGV